MNDGSVEESERGVRARTKPAQCWLLLDACERAMTVLVHALFVVFSGSLLALVHFLHLAIQSY